MKRKYVVNADDYVFRGVDGVAGVNAEGAGWLKMKLWGFLLLYFFLRKFP